MRNKPVKFGYKFWVAATPLGYTIQFYPYAGKDENYDSNLGLGGSVVATLAEKLPSQVGSNYHIIMDNFFTSPNLLRILKAKGIAATGTVGINRVESARLRPIKKMEKLERGASDVATDKNRNLTLVRWRGNKVVTVAPTFVGKMPLRKTHRYVKAQYGRAETDQPQSIFLYNKGMRGVDCLDQNISSYMIGNRSKKWWWAVCRVFLDLSANISCTVNRSALKENASWIYWDFGEVLLIHIIDVFENQQQQICSPLQERVRKSGMKFDMTQSITG